MTKPSGSDEPIANQPDEFDKKALSDTDQAQLEKDLAGLTDEDRSYVVNKKKGETWLKILQEIFDNKDYFDAFGDWKPVYKEIYYFYISKFHYFEIWNAQDPKQPGKGKKLHLEDASDKFNIFDQGSRIVTTPKELYDDNRTLLDAVKTAEAIAQEAMRRNWRAEFGGFDKMIKAAWAQMKENGYSDDNIAYFYPSEDYYRWLDKKQQTLSPRQQ
jgi:hypothetical protein